MKFGGSFRYTQSAWKNLGSNGSYNFNGSETGIDFADFLIGAPAGYSQGQGYPSNGRNLYVGGYGQDSWRVRTSPSTLDCVMRSPLRGGSSITRSKPWCRGCSRKSSRVPLQDGSFPGIRAFQKHWRQSSMTISRLASESPIRRVPTVASCASSPVVQGTAVSASVGEVLHHL